MEAVRRPRGRPPGPNKSTNNRQRPRARTIVVSSSDTSTDNNSDSPIPAGRRRKIYRSRSIRDESPDPLDDTSFTSATSLASTSSARREAASNLTSSRRKGRPPFPHDMMRAAASSISRTITRSSRQAPARLPRVTATIDDSDGSYGSPEQSSISGEEDGEDNQDVGEDSDDGSGMVSPPPARRVPTRSRPAQTSRHAEQPQYVSIPIRRRRTVIPEISPSGSSSPGSPGVPDRTSPTPSATQSSGPVSVAPRPRGRPRRVVESEDSESTSQDEPSSDGELSLSGLGPLRLDHLQRSLRRSGAHASPSNNSSDDEPSPSHHRLSRRCRPVAVGSDDISSSSSGDSSSSEDDDEQDASPFDTSDGDSDYISDQGEDRGKRVVHPPSRRGPGRPRKQAAVTASSESESDSTGRDSSTPSPPVRPRGRPSGRASGFRQQLFGQWTNREEAAESSLDSGSDSSGDSPAEEQSDSSASSIIVVRETRRRIARGRPRRDPAGRRGQDDVSEGDNNRRTRLPSASRQSTDIMELYEAGGHRLRKRGRDNDSWGGNPSRLRARRQSNSVSNPIEVFDYPTDSDYEDPGSARRHRRKRARTVSPAVADAEKDPCPICYLPFEVVPVVLPCGAGKHRFCVPCFRELRKTGTKEGGWLLCPVCRSAHSSLMVSSSMRLQKMVASTGVDPSWLD